MQHPCTHPAFLKKALRIGLAVGASALCLFFFRAIIAETLSLLFGAAAIAFFLEPPARFFERKLSRKTAAIAALASVLVFFILAAWLLLPALVRQFTHLTAILPQTLAQLRIYASEISEWIQAHLPAITFPKPAFPEPHLPDIAAATVDIAGSFAGYVYRLSLMIVLGYFFLCDRSRLMIRLEMLIPSAMRKTVVRMGNAVCRELKLYLRGQTMISAAVGSLSALGLALVRVPSPLILGSLIGILNMIPYFGPILGGIPAVLMALGMGWKTAAAAVVVLWEIQQLDSIFISPRILGGLTGLSPAAVLLAIFIGSHFSGIIGMLLALPLVMTFRTVFRVFVQRHENV